MTGSICGPMVGSPPLEISCGALELKRTAPGCSSAQLGAVNRPADGGLAGQMEGSAVTGGGAGVPSPLREWAKNPVACLLRARMSADLLDFTPCPTLATSRGPFAA